MELIVYVPDIQNRAYLTSVLEEDFLSLTGIDVPFTLGFRVVRV